MIRKFASKTLDLLLKTLYNIIIMKVDNQIVQEADNLSKETRIPFRECLDTLVRAYLAVGTSSDVRDVEAVPAR